jgi:hypothetical protein
MRFIQIVLGGAIIGAIGQVLCLILMYAFVIALTWNLDVLNERNWVAIRFFFAICWITGMACVSSMTEK